MLNIFLFTSGCPILVYIMNVHNGIISLKINFEPRFKYSILSHILLRNRRESGATGGLSVDREYRGTY